MSLVSATLASAGGIQSETLNRDAAPPPLPPMPTRVARAPLAIQDASPFLTNYDDVIHYDDEATLEKQALALEAKARELRQSAHLNRNRKALSKWLLDAQKLNFSTATEPAGPVIGCQVSSVSNNTVTVTIWLAPK